MKAATRDAQWHDRPDAHRTKKYHALTPEGFPGCGRMMMPNDDDTIDAALVPDFRRCHAPGCRAMFAATRPPEDAER